METISKNPEAKMIHVYKEVLPIVFKSIGLDTKIASKFEWFNTQVLYKGMNFLTLEAIPGYIDTNGIYINHRFNSPLFRGLDKIKDQVSEMSEYLDKTKVIHVVAQSAENPSSFEGYGIVIPFGDSTGNVSKALNLVWAEPKPDSAINKLSWELRRGDWAHTSTFLMKAMGIQTKIILG